MLATHLCESPPPRILALEKFACVLYYSLIMRRFLIIKKKKNCIHSHLKQKCEYIYIYLSLIYQNNKVLQHFSNKFWGKKKDNVFIIE